MGGITVHTVGAAGRNDANLGHALPSIDAALVLLHMGHGMANLHRAGVCAQQMATFDVEGVVHGACRMVFGGIEGGEIEPIGFNFRTLGHFETHGREDIFNPLHAQADGVQSACSTQRAGQADIQGLGLELSVEFCVGQRLTALRQRCLDGLLGRVDDRALGFLGLDVELRESFHELGDASGLAQVLRFGILQISGRGATGKQILGLRHQGIKVVHRVSV